MPADFVCLTHVNDGTLAGPLDEWVDAVVGSTGPSPVFEQAQQCEGPGSAGPQRRCGAYPTRGDLVPDRDAPRVAHCLVPIGLTCTCMLGVALGSIGVKGQADEAVELVLTIARLGDADLRRWWRTQGLSRTGELVLSRSFPRTWMTAAIDLSLRSAARHHDERLGRASAIHLLSDRLPYRRWALSWLAERKLTTADTALRRLGMLEISSAEASIMARAGPQPSSVGERLGAGLRLGALSRDDLDASSGRSTVARRLAAAYCGQDAELAVPYFDQA